MNLRDELKTISDKVNAKNAMREQFAVKLKRYACNGTGQLILNLTREEVEFLRDEKLRVEPVYPWASSEALRSHYRVCWDYVKGQ